MIAAPRCFLSPFPQRLSHKCKQAASHELESCWRQTDISSCAYTGRRAGLRSAIARRSHGHVSWPSDRRAGGLPELRLRNNFGCARDETPLACDDGRRHLHVGAGASPRRRRPGFAQQGNRYGQGRRLRRAALRVRCGTAPYGPTNEPAACIRVGARFGCLPLHARASLPRRVRSRRFVRGRLLHREGRRSECHR